MISYLFKIIKITNVIAWNELLFEIICTLKQVMNGPSPLANSLFTDFLRIFYTPTQKWASVIIFNTNAIKNTIFETKLQ